MFAGVYGDVQRVKILFNKKDSALIQMADMNQAQLGKIHTETSLTAQQLLSRLSLHSSQIQLSSFQALKMTSNQNRLFFMQNKCPCFFCTRFIQNEKDFIKI